MKEKIKELSEEKKKEQLQKQRQYLAIEKYLRQLPDDPDIKQLLTYSGKRLIFLETRDGIILNSKHGRRRIHALACSSKGLEEYCAQGPYAKTISYNIVQHFDDVLEYIHELAQERGVKIRLANIRRETEVGIEKILGRK